MDFPHKRPVLWKAFPPRHFLAMGLLPDTWNCGLRMRRECRERISRHRLQRKPLVSDPGMHHGTCVTHVPWCMSESLARGGGENVSGIPGACANRNFTYLVRGPWHDDQSTKNRLPRTWVPRRPVVRKSELMGPWTQPYRRNSVSPSVPEMEKNDPIKDNILTPYWYRFNMELFVGTLTRVIHFVSCARLTVCGWEKRVTKT